MLIFQFGRWLEVDCRLRKLSYQCNNTDVTMGLIKAIFYFDLPDINIFLCSFFSVKTIVNRTFPGLIHAVGPVNEIAPAIEYPHLEFFDIGTITNKSIVDSLTVVRRKCIGNIEGPFRGYY